MVNRPIVRFWAAGTGGDPWLMRREEARAEEGDLGDDTHQEKGVVGEKNGYRKGKGHLGKTTVLIKKKHQDFKIRGAH